MADTIRTPVEVSKVARAKGKVRTHLRDVLNPVLTPDAGQE